MGLLFCRWLAYVNTIIDLQSLTREDVMIKRQRATWMQSGMTKLRLTFLHCSTGGCPKDRMRRYHDILSASGLLLRDYVTLNQLVK